MYLVRLPTFIHRLVMIKNYLKVYNKKFYKTNTWKIKRKTILKRDNFECQMCKDEGLYSKATTVHHIKHYDKFPELGLTDENLISLCASCHNKVHPERNFEIKKRNSHSERWE